MKRWLISLVALGFVTGCIVKKEESKDSDKGSEYSNDAQPKDIQTVKTIPSSNTVAVDPATTPPAPLGSDMKPEAPDALLGVYYAYYGNDVCAPDASTQTIEITKDHLYFTVVQYDNFDCIKEAAVYSVAYKIAGYSTTTSNLDFSIESASLTILISDIAKDFRDKKYYEFDDWKENVAKDITNRKFVASDPSPAFRKDTRFYGYMRMTKDFFEFGDANVVAANRPVVGTPDSAGLYFKGP